MTEALASIVGARHVVTDPADLARYNADGRTGGGRARCVVRPGSVAELSALVRHAAATGLRLVPQGGRSGLVGAGLGDGDDVVVSLERLSAAPVIDPVNRTATVEAGVALSAVNAAAAAHGLTFPIDLGADPSIGGMVAANTGGARLLRHGDVRRNVLALEMVRSDADGSVLTLGAPLWKNNTGLDLKQLLIGASGTTGFVTKATLALQPLPVARTTALVALTAPEAALDLLLAVEAAFGTLLTAFEGISAAALRAALSHVPRLTDPFPGHAPAYVVLIELAAGAAFDADLLEDRLAATLAPWFDGAVLDVAIDRGDRLWAIRHAVPEGLRASGTVVACDIALPRGAVMRFREVVSARLAAEIPALSVHDFGHIGDGGLHYNMVWPRAAGAMDPAIADRARAIVFTAAVKEFGGSFSAEHGIGPANAHWYDRFVPAATRALAGAVQRLIAPHPLGRIDLAGEQP